MGTTLTAPSCDGIGIWDFGASDVLANSLTLTSETDGLPNTNSRFPRLDFWEYNPTLQCSLLFSFENLADIFNLDGSLINDIGTSAENLVVAFTDGTEVFGTPAAVSIDFLFSLPDCPL